MATDKYLHVHYYSTVKDFTVAMDDRNKEIIAVDNVDGSISLGEVGFAQNTVLVFGAEGPGLSEELLKASSKIVAIEQFGSTRSINVGVAAGITMYRWVQDNLLAN